MRKLWLIPLAAFALAACDPVPQNGVNQQAASAFEGKDPKDVFPNVSSNTFLSAFDAVCDNNAGNLKRAAGVLRGNGMVDLLTQDGVTMYADPKGQFPMTGLGKDRASGMEICMVVAPDSRSLRSAVDSYMGRKGLVELPIAGQVPGALKAWTNGSLVYITMEQNNPAFGKTFALMVAPI